jgi:hypothetical protein
MVSRHQASQADRQKKSGSYQFYGLPKNTSTGLERTYLISKYMKQKCYNKNLFIPEMKIK